MTAVHKTNIISIALCENFIIFRLTLLLSKIVFLRAQSVAGMSKATDIAFDQSGSLGKAVSQYQNYIQFGKEKTQKVN
jgi:hypothetical protein